MTSLGGPSMVDWNLAVTTATRLLRPGPEVSREEARAVVAELRAHAKSAVEHVRAYTGMNPPPSADTPVLVVDRPGWVRANVAGFRSLLAPLLDKMQGRRNEGGSSSIVTALGGKVTGAELGVLLSFLSSRVLGQYETFAPPSRELPGGTGGGRLLLVAPNIVHVERELGVDPGDFRLWVTLHEETHRTQFTGVPWLRDHLENEIRGFLDETELDPGHFADRLGETVRSLFDREGRAKTAPEDEEDGASLVELVQTPAQREILGRLTAVMSLLEGHADYVMDGVGPAVVPSVGEIREKFQERRAKGASRIDLALRRLLGLDAKLRQYRDGERFVRAVVDEKGMAGFNRVWTSPNTLPTKREIHHPAEWIARVHGEETGGGAEGDASTGT